MLKNKKGQLSIGEAPMIVMIVGLTFLLMATVAYVGEKYGNATDTDDTSVTAVNESVTRTSIISASGATLTAINKKNGECSSLTYVLNGTNGITIANGNFSITTACVMKNTSSMANYTATNFLVTYPYTYSAATTASNVTDALGTEINANTSIAGIVLTISLVGIVLTVLIGIFVMARQRGM